MLKMPLRPLLKAPAKLLNRRHRGQNLMARRYRKRLLLTSIRLWLCKPRTVPLERCPELRSPRPPPELPFPTRETLKTGSAAAGVRAAFGPPAFDTVSNTEGRVREKYYYVNRDRSRLTVMTIENGLVMSVDSLSAPYFQLPGAK